MTYRGIFKPLNPSKYKGDPTKIVYRSGWELKLMSYLDQHKDVIEWRSEEIVIPYKSPIDGRYHRYFPDFVIKKRERDGTIKTIMIEVKPASQCQPPKQVAIPNKRYLKEVARWGVNSAKWEAAREYCKDQRWDFLIMTEKHLGIK